MAKQQKVFIIGAAGMVGASAAYAMTLKETASEIVLIDIKSGGARLTKGQQAIAQAMAEGRVRFETIRIDFDEL